VVGGVVQAAAVCVLLIVVDIVVEAAVGGSNGLLVELLDVIVEGGEVSELLVGKFFHSMVVVKFLHSPL